MRFNGLLTLLNFVKMPILNNLPIICCLLIPNKSVKTNDILTFYNHTLQSLKYMYLWNQYRSSCKWNPTNYSTCIFIALGVHLIMWKMLNLAASAIPSILLVYTICQSRILPGSIHNLRLYSILIDLVK